MFVDFQRWGPEVVALPQIRSVVGRDARVTLATIGMGSSTTKGAIACNLVEPGSSGELLGLMFADGQQHFELDTLQEHAAGHTESRLLFKTALEGSSTVIGNGMVRIEKAAQKSDAYQENRNLVLSPHAHADPIPALEILANDVRCSHGTTVGPIDDDQTFYLQCRGLPRDEAERLIVRGFFRDVLDRLPAEIEARLTDEIERKAEVLVSRSNAA
jgi:Fe-S cluster assembly protein SufD